jgi:phosphoribosylaminoimidazole (AIR) synthetase
MTVSEALLSPTRQWAIVIKKIMEELKKQNALEMLHGISMNTGGGATKIKNIGGGGFLYIKNMPYPPALFQLIKNESFETWENMYQSFNCGIGIDVVGENNPVFDKALQKVSDDCTISVYKTGSAHRIPDNGKNEVVVKTVFGDFKY